MCLHVIAYHQIPSIQPGSHFHPDIKPSHFYSGVHGFHTRHQCRFSCKHESGCWMCDVYISQSQTDCTLKTIICTSRPDITCTPPQIARENLHYPTYTTKSPHDAMLAGNGFFHLPRKIVVGIAGILLLGALLVCAKSHWGAHAPKLLAHISPSMTAAGAYRPAEMSDSAAANTAVAKHIGRYIFLDLGANKADTLKVFLGYPDAKFNFSFATPPNDTRGPQDAEIFLFEANVRDSRLFCIISQL